MQEKYIKYKMGDPWKPPLFWFSALRGRLEVIKAEISAFVSLPEQVETHFLPDCTWLTPFAGDSAPAAPNWRPQNGA